MLAIRTMPPFLMSSVRFLLAGGFLFVLSPRRRASLRAWAAALVVGGALLTIGNGGITWAKQRVDSGTAALLVARSEERRVGKEGGGRWAAEDGEEVGGD